MPKRKRLDANMIFKNFMRFISRSSIIFILVLSIFRQVNAHEVLPNIADIRIEGKSISIDLRFNVEAFLSDINLSELVSTDEAEQIESYQKFRTFTPSDLSAAFETKWKIFTDLIKIKDANGSLLTNYSYKSLDVENLKNLKLPRLSRLSFAVKRSKDLSGFTVTFDERLGSTFLRQSEVEYGLEQSLSAGQTSKLINTGDGEKRSALDRLLNYIPIGFKHVVPNGFDHILFVMGLFLLSLKTSTLLWQVSAFTLAHTITLIASSFGIISVPGYIVEPLIAASIVFVAVENIFFSKVNSWRATIVIVFGLLHGLGFASVLAEFGLPTNHFLPALIGFNIGVELGQLGVILLALLLLGLPFGKSLHYRTRVTIPISLIIALIGTWWFIERTIFT